MHEILSIIYINFDLIQLNRYGNELYNNVNKKIKQEGLATYQECKLVDNIPTNPHCKLVHNNKKQQLLFKKYIINCLIFK